jgi:flagellin
MSFSINTNVASLQAQNYLRTSSDFQGKTISRVTSGLRIVQSGDDAAGLAIANGYRSDEAVLTQGIRNANDGLSQLQIADGGLNNISQLIDRARTLATQSASGTFTGDRTVLNKEFQNVVGEIDRQAQAIGLNQNGTFAKAISVFIGGGKGLTSSGAISNGSVGIDLSQNTVDSKSLGLSGLQALGNGNPAANAVSTVDIGTGSKFTSVSAILTDSNNVSTEAVPGNTVFSFTGPGFSDATTGAAPVKVSVNLNGVTDTTTLVSAINSAIASTGNGTNPQSTAFKNANIVASIVTDSSGRQQLAFNSSTSAFQVQAGDNIANALIGNLATPNTNADGVSAFSTVASGATVAAVASTGTFKLRVIGLGQATATDLTVNVTAADTGAAVATDVQTAINGNAALKAQGLTVAYNSASHKFTFSGPAGGTFEIQVSNDSDNALGFGTLTSGGANFDTTSYTGAAAPAASVLGSFQISIGGATQTVTANTGAALSNTIANLNTAIQANAALKGAGIYATSDATNTFVQINSSTGTSFRIGVTGNDNIFNNGTASTGVVSNGTDVSKYAAVNTLNSGGAQESVQYGSNTDAYSFTGIRVSGESQVVSLTSTDSNGTQHALNITLNTTNGNSLDQALKTINASLQQTNDSTLQKLYAVKEQNGASGTEGIRFLSTESFKVSLGTSASGAGITDSSGIVGSTAQGESLSSATLAGGSLADITNQSTAEAAVTALGNAVSKLGTAQAVVGRGENQFTYAVNLAQSQLTNTQTAESRIRDADLASEAANLTKAQILIQAGVAALAQANSAPEQVLSLLRG